MPQDLLEQLQAALGDAYAIERELGGGGLSRVFLAEERALGRRVVIKVVPPELGGALNAERFRREILLAARLQHPHIVPLLAAGQSDDVVYYTMPYIEGTPLRDRLSRNGGLPLGEAVRILCDVASALAYAHEHGIVHRDIKPDNILLSGRYALVTDFGVAKALSSASGDAALTSGGIAVGTLAYMAPEQITADPTADHRVDIYALGVLGYELLTGQRPFGTTTTGRGAFARTADTPEPVDRYRPTVPPALASLIMCCLEPNRADRPQSAEEVRVRLEETGAALGHGFAATTWPWLRAHRRAAFIGGGAVVLLLTAAIGGSALLRAAPANPRRIVIAPFENQTRDPALGPLGQVIADQIARQLMRAGFSSVEIVEPNTVRAQVQFRSATDRDSAGSTPHALAVAAGAGKVVSGSYYLARDSIEFQARITDEAADGKLLRALEPVRGARADPQPALVALQRSVAASVAILFDRLPVVPFPRQPSLEAYQWYVEGAEKWVRLDWRGAIPELLRANAVDTTFTLPLLAAAIAYKNLDLWPQADSLARLVDRHRTELSAFERHSLDWLLASIRGDRTGRLDAIQAAAQEQPGSDLVQYQLGQELSTHNRPCDALRVLNALDPERGVVRAGWYVYYDYLTAAHHMLGQHWREMRAATKGRAQYPELLSTLYYLARAEAARGDIVEVRQLLDESAAKPVQVGWTPADVAVNTALELRAHGHADAAGDAFSRAIRWYEARQATERATEGSRFALARTFYLAGRWPEARVRFDSLSAAAPDSLSYQGYVGMLAARRRDRRRAREIADRLAASERPYLQGENELWAARISALLGQRELAVDRLRTAFAQGLGYDIERHTDIDLEPLRDYAPYEELMRPRCGALARLDPRTW